MKNPIIFLVITMLAIACSKEEQAPSTQTQLAVVVFNVNSQNTSNKQLWLTDGRLANPVSGIPNFSTMAIGDKLSLSFKTKATHDNVVDIEVNSFSETNEAVFKPKQLTESDFTVFGSLSGDVYSPRTPSAGDTTTVFHQEISISLNSDYTYTCAGVVNGYPAAGSGTFTTTHGTFSWYGIINFTDNNTSSDAVLNGTFKYMINNDNTLSLYGTSNGIEYSFYLK